MSPSASAKPTSTRLPPGVSLRRARLIDNREGAYLRLAVDGKAVALVLTEEHALALGLALVDLVTAIRRGEHPLASLEPEAGG